MKFFKISGVLAQYYTVLVANLTTISFGIAVGWPSGNLLLLSSEKSPLKTGAISVFEASWISSVICLGGAIGTIFYGWFVEVIGRKKAMMSIFIPDVVSYCVTYKFIFFLADPNFSGRLDDDLLGIDTY